MLDLKEKYIINKQQKPVAVQLDIKIFKRLEDVLEDYALTQYMKETDLEEKLTLNEAKTYYKRLKKNSVEVVLPEHSLKI
ncbi:hypothetical protein [Parafilimonas sp.]|uniref:hypothetical protein n=1 Tax=Parafilimonas sp. TaxID=1969739 RepID=UPI0039E60C69